MNAHEQHSSSPLPMGLPGMSARLPAYQLKRRHLLRSLFVVPFFDLVKSQLSFRVKL
jgi:hypothetical protein